MGWNWTRYSKSSNSGLLNALPIVQFLSKDVNESQEYDNINAVGDYSDGAGVACIISGNNINDVAHGLENEQRIKFVSGVLPVEIIEGKIYYVCNKTNDFFRVAVFPYSTPITLTGFTENVEYSVSGAIDFCIKNKMQKKYYYLEVCLVHIVTSGKFNSGLYGKDITLSNGIKLINGSCRKQHEYEYDATTDNPIKVNTDWDCYCGAPNTKNSTYGVGNESLGGVLHFTYIGRPVVLDGDIEEFFCIRLNDNFEPLVKQMFGIRGTIVDKNVVN